MHFSHVLRDQVHRLVSVGLWSMIGWTPEGAMFVHNLANLGNRPRGSGGALMATLNTPQPGASKVEKCEPAMHQSEHVRCYFGAMHRPVTVHSVLPNQRNPTQTLKTPNRSPAGVGPLDLASEPKSV